jgi:hypothetical protein
MALRPVAAARDLDWLRLRRFLLLAAVSVATRSLALFVDVLDVDETAHVVGAWELLRGRVLYAEFVDNKPPLLYAFYALTQLLLGRGLFAVHVVTVLVMVPLAAWAASAFRGHGRSGRLAGVLLLVYGAAFLAHDMLAANAELLMMPAASLAVVLVRDEERARRARSLLGAGVLLGVAALFKYQAATWLPALGVALLLAPPEAGRWKRVALLCAGFGLPLGATWLAFRAVGAADALVYWTIGNNLVYTANPIPAWEALGRAAASLIPFAVVTAPLWWLSARGIRNEPSRYRRVLVSGLLAGAVLSATLGLRFFPHYLVQLYWPLAVAAAPAAADLLSRRPRTRAAVAFVAWSAAMLAGFTVANLWLYLGPARVYRERDPVFRQVGEWLRADPCSAGGSLFVWGYAPAFYYEARLPAASRFVVLGPTRLTPYVSGNLASLDGASGGVVAAHWDWLMQDLEDRRATYILDTAPAGIFRWDRYPLRAYPRLQACVDGQFELAGVVSGVRVYRRRGCAQGAGARRPSGERDSPQAP